MQTEVVNQFALWLPRIVRTLAKLNPLGDFDLFVRSSPLQPQDSGIADSLLGAEVRGDEHPAWHGVLLLRMVLLASRRIRFV